MLRLTIALILVLLGGGTALWWGTEGGQAFTAETARRLDIAKHPRPLPPTALADSSGATLSLDQYHGGPLVLEFIYASCPDICVALGTAFEQLDAAAPGGTHLLSVSFDPEDDARSLGAFADRHGATAPRWRVAAVPDSAARSRLLEHAGVVVIPDGMGGFVHNAGLYVVDPTGHLIAVFDPDDTKAALSMLDRLAQR